MRAVRSSPEYTNSNDDRPHYRLRSWRWENFECSTGCCGDTGSQHCCTEKNNAMNNPGLITAVSVGIFLLIVTLVIIVICCMCHRSRQKRSQRMRRRRHTVASLTPSACSQPPSYEMTVAMSAHMTGVAFPAEVHAPPSYEEVMALTAPASQHANFSTHVHAHAHERAHVHGRDNLGFSVLEETVIGPAPAYVIS
ncbi:uncharacterized protein [Littorina saxatilis]